MKQCHDRPAVARSFVVTPYVQNEGEDRLSPLWPDEGPCRDEPGDCRIVLDHWRERSTGPCFDLAVARCSPHRRRGFTLYPPGHVPYGRKAVAPVASNGDLKEKEGVSGAEAFRGTMWDAALDAAEGQAWTRPSTSRMASWYWGPTEGWWSTQRRRLDALVALVGIDPSLPDQGRHEMAGLLGIAVIVLHEAAGDLVRLGGGYKEYGKAVCRVLGKLALKKSVAQRLTCAGHQAGLWGEPLFWLPDQRSLRPKPFQATRTRGPPAAR